MKFLTIAEMKRGELLQRLDEELQACAKDMHERSEVDGPRVVNAKIVMKEEGGIVQITFETERKLPKSTPALAIGYLKNGKLVADADAEDIMQPTFMKVAK